MSRATINIEELTEEMQALRVCSGSLPAHRVQEQSEPRPGSLGDELEGSWLNFASWNDASSDLLDCLNLDERPPTPDLRRNVRLPPLISLYESVALRAQDCITSHLQQDVS